jgi:hypothetical protein
VAEPEKALKALALPAVKPLATVAFILPCRVVICSYDKAVTVTSLKTLSVTVK